MDIVLVSGFLGAGKTTRIMRWLGQADASDTALIINEVGQIGLDSILIGQTNNALQMQLLANGCLCCSAGNSPGPVIAQLALAHRERTGRALKRVVIEASGLARPTKIVRELSRYNSGYVNALRVVCVVDAMLDVGLQEGTEAIDQIASADYIVLSREDSASAAQQAYCRQALARINPLASVVEGGELGFAINVQHVPILRFDAITAQGNAAVHNVTVAVFKPRRMAAAYLIEWMENLYGACGPRLLRVKGLVELEDQKELVCVQSVGGLISPLQPLEATPAVIAPFLVVIARQMGLDQLADIDPEASFALR